ncbi:hypothetical protein D3C87_1880740 [compost metagenome]
MDNFEMGLFLDTFFSSNFDCIAHDTLNMIKIMAGIVAGQHLSHIGLCLRDDIGSGSGSGSGGGHTFVKDRRQLRGKVSCCGCRLFLYELV